ncbi:MAG: Fructose dehydrogenase cytochrome subunit [Alphaproteobacteria bacterium MarineAlpha2_Bin1]|nr:MAG: Fructose dehydrogenase cytochrome subunit [Alphaproteobacteria bacterium MarineAlpha2_Bin1]
MKVNILFYSMNRYILNIYRKPIYIILCIFLSIFFSKLSYSEDNNIKNGEYISILGGCYSCHTGDNSNELFAGGRAIITDFGVFYSPNITPDKTTGIGNWSDADFINAFRRGISPDGYHYLPVFPYTSYTGIRDEDLLNLKKYLFSLKPINKVNKSHEVFFIFKINFIKLIWKKLFFLEKEFQFNNKYSKKWNRGNYIVNHLAHCGECHTPRNLFGASLNKKFLIGSNSSAIGEKSPNITGDLDIGIGSWTPEEFTDFMLNGIKPDFDNVQGSMDEVIMHSTSKFDFADIISIYEYLKTIKIN